ncbi:DUF6682 family protein [Thiolinea disciformis]|uniref:phage adaptor protein n=1 Tax=Thiolinea disciformis TaxID=125614 RepID=UPI0003A503E3|nr:DUF6682 family protein [Thiolinea disciformis]
MVDTGALTLRAAELLTDELFDFWQQSFHDHSINEAICIIAEMGNPDDLMACVEMVTKAGANQELPEGLGSRFIKVVSNQSGRAIRYYDNQALSNLMPCWAEKTSLWKGYVEFWTKGCTSKRGFAVFPPTPAGHVLLIGILKNPDDLTADDLGCKYMTAIIDYMLWRAFEREGSENSGKWQAYRQSFWDTLGVYKTVEVERELRARGVIGGVQT